MHALLIDIGNTSLKIGVAGIEGLVASYTLPTDTQQSGDGLGLQLAYLLGHAGFGTPGTGPGNVALDGCVISSVVPGMNPLVAHACKRFLELTPRFAHRDLPIPLENRYERPNEVGADRLVGAFGARRLPRRTDLPRRHVLARGVGYAHGAASAYCADGARGCAHCRTEHGDEPEPRFPVRLCVYDRRAVCASDQDA